MTPEASNELLAQLRDIHEAPLAPVWPPAPGWWLLAVLVLLAFAWIIRKLWRYWGVRRRRRDLVGTLARLREEFHPEEAPQRYLSSVNRLLKVAAMRAFPERDCGALQGQAWVQFLAGDSDQAGALEPLALGPYQPTPEFDAGALESAAQEWLSRHA